MMTTFTDREQILELIAAAADATTTRNAEVFAAGWAPHATWTLDAPMDVTMAGSGQELAAGFIQGMDAMWVSYLQLVHQSTVAVSGDTATARSYISEQGVGVDGRGQYLHGVYDDEFVRTPEGWRFSSRHFKYLHLNREAVPGVSAEGGALRVDAARL